LGFPDQQVKSLTQMADLRNQNISLWEFTYQWVSTALSQLSDLDYPMAVISNADGRVEKSLGDLGLSIYFNRVFDSHHLGVEKPDRGIFDFALSELGLQPNEAIYIGDVFFIDVWGANQAGIGGIHLDPLGLYTKWPGVHLPDISHLADWLRHYQFDPGKFDLFPTL
jgi:putative hydrolase of the HAD superfamily